MNYNDNMRTEYLPLNYQFNVMRLKSLIESKDTSASKPRTSFKSWLASFTQPAKQRIAQDLNRYANTNQ